MSREARINEQKRIQELLNTENQGYISPNDPRMAQAILNLIHLSNSITDHGMMQAEPDIIRILEDGARKCKKLLDQLEMANSVNDELRQEREKESKKNNRLAAEIKKLKTENQGLLNAVQLLQAENDRLKRDNNSLKSQQPQQVSVVQQASAVPVQIFSAPAPQPVILAPQLTLFAPPQQPSSAIVLQPATVYFK